MKILVDTNILVDFAKGMGYARRFFETAKEKYYEICIPKEVYFQAKNLIPKFHRIKGLIEELKSQDIYIVLSITSEEIEYACSLIKICLEIAGQDLGEVDRRILAIAKLRNLTIFTVDQNLRKVAKIEKIKLI